MSISRFFALALLACSSAENRAPGASQYAEPEPLPFAQPAGEKCTEGDHRTCRNTVKGADEKGYTDCFEGVQTCSGGVWSACLSDRTVAAAARVCMVDALDIARRALSPIDPAIARVWGNAPNAKPFARFSELNGLTKLAIGDASFDVALSELHGFSLSERAATFSIDGIPFVAVMASGRLNAECNDAVAMSITLTIPASAGTMPIGDTTIDALFGGASEYNGVRGYRFTLSTESK